MSGDAEKPEGERIHQFILRIPEDLFQKLRQSSSLSFRSVHQEILFALDQHLRAVPTLTPVTKTREAKP